MFDPGLVQHTFLQHTFLQHTFLQHTFLQHIFLQHHAFLQQQQASHQLASSSGVKHTSVAEWDYVWGVWGSSVGIMALYAWRTLRRGRRLAGALSPARTAEAPDGLERSVDR